MVITTTTMCSLEIPEIFERLVVLEHLTDRSWTRQDVATTNVQIEKAQVVSELHQ